MLSPTASNAPGRTEMSPHAQDVPRPQYGKDSTYILLTLMVVKCQQIVRGCQKWIMQPPLPRGQA